MKGTSELFISKGDSHLPAKGRRRCRARMWSVICNLKAGRMYFTPSGTWFLIKHVASLLIKIFSILENVIHVYNETWSDPPKGEEGAPAPSITLSARPPPAAAFLFDNILSAWVWSHLLEPCPHLPMGTASEKNDSPSMGWGLERLSPSMPKSSRFFFFFFSQGLVSFNCQCNMIWSHLEESLNKRLILLVCRHAYGETVYIMLVEVGSWGGTTPWAWSCNV